jgi:hypothetical protein
MKLKQWQGQKYQHELSASPAKTTNLLEGTVLWLQILLLHSLDLSFFFSFSFPNRNYYHSKEINGTLTKK